MYSVEEDKVMEEERSYAMRRDVTREAAVTRSISKRDQKRNDGRHRDRGDSRISIIEPRSTNARAFLVYG